MKTYIVDRDGICWNDVLALSDHDRQETIHRKRFVRSEARLMSSCVARLGRRYRMSWVEVRGQLKEISLSNWRAMPESSLISRSDSERFPVSEGWYLFTDDDDFYCPGLDRALRNIDPSTCNVVHWTHYASGHYLHPMTLGDVITSNYLDSNSYAVHSDFINRSPGNVQHVFKHGRVHGAIRKHIDGLKVHFNEDLAGSSFFNRTPASGSLFQRHFLHGDDATFDRCLENFVSRGRRHLRGEGAGRWYAPWFDQCIDVFEALLSSRN